MHTSVNSPIDLISDSPPDRTMLVEPRRYQSLYYQPVETTYFKPVHSGSSHISIHYRYRLETTIRRTRTGRRVIVGSSQREQQTKIAMHGDGWIGQIVSGNAAGSLSLNKRSRNINNYAQAGLSWNRLGRRGISGGSTPCY